MSSTNCSRSEPAGHRQVECSAVGHFIHLPVGRVLDCHRRKNELANFARLF